jgi:hypothetical protein
LVTCLFSRIHSPSAADDQLGGVWAVIATVFVCRFSYHESIVAALSRISAAADFVVPAADAALVASYFSKSLTQPPDRDDGTRQPDRP